MTSLLNHTEVLRQVARWSLPPGWYPVVTFDLGGDWFSVHLTRGLDQTDAVVMDMVDATAVRVGSYMDALVDEAIGLGEWGEVLTIEDITGRDIDECASSMN